MNVFCESAWNHKIIFLEAKDQDSCLSYITCRSIEVVKGTEISLLTKVKPYENTHK